jgi:hypothetical protein
MYLVLRSCVHVEWCLFCVLLCVCGVDLAAAFHSFFLLASFKLVYYTHMPIYHEG